MTRINLLIIGDEILNGRRKDQHLANTIESLEERGLELHRSINIGDEREMITETLKFLNTENNIVFSFGGIGATPDDVTRQCAADAFGEPLMVHEEGRRILEKRFGDKINPHRINLINFPRNSKLIPNPYNNIPGFSYDNFHFVPGFPQMAKPMVAWVLDNEYHDIFPGEKLIRKSFRVFERSEGDLTELMEELVNQFPNVRLSCLPRIDVKKIYVDLSILANKAEVQKAEEYIERELDNLQAEWE